MRPCDIDRTVNPWKYEPERHKTEHHGKERVIFIGPKAQEVLSPYLLRGSDAYCFSPAESEEKRLAAVHAKRKTPLSCGNRPEKRTRVFSDQYDKDSYRQAVVRACKKSGVPHWTPYQLRHTRATDIRKLFGLEAVQTVLGHSNAKTSEIYAEKNLELAAQVAAEVG